MKDHLNVGTITNPTGWMDNNRPSEVRAKHPESKQEALEDTLLSNIDDLFAGTSSGVDFDESLIEGMDFNAALESLSFIRQQADTTEGRKMMGNAHREITAEKVMQLFG